MPADPLPVAAGTVAAGTVAVGTGAVGTGAAGSVAAGTGAAGGWLSPRPAATRLISAQTRGSAQ
jgi:hypothetical protein